MKRETKELLRAQLKGALVLISVILILGLASGLGGCLR